MLPKPADWPTWRPETWHDLSDALDRTARWVWKQSAYGVMYRGQKDAAWPLLPSLTREFLRAGTQAAEAIDLEFKLLGQFHFQAHLKIDVSLLQPDSQGPTFTIWAVMQHYGAPTRLLDWTGSPFAGLYFAAVDLGPTDGCLWAVNAGATDAEMRRRYVYSRPADHEYRRTDADPIIVFYFKERPTDRMVAQQGIFSVSTQVLAEHSRLIHEALDPGQYPDSHVRIVIPAGLKPEIMWRLKAMNVTANSLFPGIDGLGRSCAEWLLFNLVHGGPSPRPTAPAMAEPTAPVTGSKRPRASRKT
jgi:FRG domain-containing protein